MKQTCASCGTRLLDASVFCHRCGQRLDDRRVDDRRVQNRRFQNSPPENSRSEDAVHRERLERKKRRRRHSRARAARASFLAPGGGGARTRQSSDAGSSESKRKRRPGARHHLFPDSPDDQERSLWSDTFSAKAMAGHWLVAAAVTVLLPVVARRLSLTPELWNATLVALAGGWVALLIYLAFRKLDSHYELTTQRFVHEHGILVRHTHRIEVIDIDDIVIRQGILERLLDVGSLVIVSSDESDPVFEMVGIDRVHAVAEYFEAARREERIRRGVHIEAV